ncbi:hypothetical protein PM082_012229 [Marasmius tenuissimus]|nr:hypothetical protein PM082_012229 [Marasmius tenuissimus]
MNPNAVISLIFWTLFYCNLVRGVYIPFREYSGNNFFVSWDYYGAIDNTTWGNVTYLDQPNAIQQRLTYVDPNTGHAILRVDNTTNLPPAPLVNRNTVRITTKEAFDIGSLVILDATHIPYGCSVWPAFWTLGVGLEWPDAGEIDVIEGINNLPFNQMAMHTTNGCFQAANGGQTGRTVNTNCTRPEGCLVQETKPNSFGVDFARAGGGAWALQFDVAGVFIWFWSRPDIPKSVSQAQKDSNLELSDWGAPSAAYRASACDIRSFFKPQKLVINTSLCGLWAGVPDIYAQTCPGTCISQVFGNGANYANAWWDISYVRVYRAVDNTTTATSSSPGTSTSTTTGQTTSRPGGSGTNTSTGNNASIAMPVWFLTIGLALLVPVWVVSL